MLKKLTAREMAEGKGAKVRRIFPNGEFRHLDPFVLCDEFFVEQPAKFSPHEHGGFEAMSYMLQGEFKHEDNLGNESTVKAGGVQLFNAGSGITHSEEPGAKGVSNGIQLWVNLPQELKDSKPFYKMYEASKLPQRKTNGVEVKVVVGERSPVKLSTDFLFLDLLFTKQANFEYEIPKGYQGLVYLVESEAEFEGQEIVAGDAVVFSELEEVELKGVQETRAILIAGKPHEEEIKQHGSFVK